MHCAQCRTRITSSSDKPTKVTKTATNSGVFVVQRRRMSLWLTNTNTWLIYKKKIFQNLLSSAWKMESSHKIRTVVEGWNLCRLVSSRLQRYDAYEFLVAANLPPKQPQRWHKDTPTFAISAYKISSMWKRLFAAGEPHSRMPHIAWFLLLFFWLGISKNTAWSSATWFLSTAQMEYESMNFEEYRLE